MNKFKIAFAWHLMQWGAAAKSSVDYTDDFIVAKARHDSAAIYGEINPEFNAIFSVALNECQLVGIPEEGNERTMCAHILAGAILQNVIGDARPPRKKALYEQASRAAGLEPVYDKHRLTLETIMVNMISSYRNGGSKGDKDFIFSVGEILEEKLKERA